MKLGVQHWGPLLIIVCSNDDPCVDLALFYGKVTFYYLDFFL